ncbi:hypothetical protein F2Q70_00012922, partial [Brassica cretica]
MDPQHTGDLFKHLEKQNELLKEAHKTMSQELQKLMVEEQMMMHKLYEITVTHRKNNKEMKKTKNVLEGKETLEEASSLAMVPTETVLRALFKERFDQTGMVFSPAAIGIPKKPMKILKIHCTN